MRSRIIPQAHLYSLHSLFTITFTLLPVVLLLLPKTHAQLLDPCGVSAASLAFDPRVQSCLPIQPLVRLIIDPITPSIVNATTAEFCTYPVCQPETVALIENTLQQNCINLEEDRLGLEYIFGMASLYPSFKEGLCQRQSLARVGGQAEQEGMFCTAVLTESMLGYMKAEEEKGHAPPRSRHAILNLLANSTALQGYVDAIPKAVLCSRCNKAMVEPMDSFVRVHQLELDPSVVRWSLGLRSQIEQKCGADFLEVRDLPGRPLPQTLSGVGSGRSSPWWWTTMGTVMGSFGPILFSLI